MSSSKIELEERNVKSISSCAERLLGCAEVVSTAMPALGAVMVILSPDVSKEPLCSHKGFCLVAADSSRSI